MKNSVSSPGNSIFHKAAVLNSAKRNSLSSENSPTNYANSTLGKSLFSSHNRDRMGFGDYVNDLQYSS